MIGDAVVSAARQCLGTPFRHQGRIPGVGLDCLGLILHVGNAIERPLKAPSAYPKDPAHQDLLAGAEANENLVRITDLTALQPGDIPVIQIGNRLRHFAIYTGPTLIHVWDGGVNQVCEHVIDERWRRRGVAAYRFVEGVTWV